MEASTLSTGSSILLYHPLCLPDTDTAAVAGPWALSPVKKQSFPPEPQTHSWNLIPLTPCILKFSN